MKYILLQPRKRLLHAGERKRKVHPDSVCAVERPSVLPCDTDIPSGLQQFVHRLSMCLAPRFTVKEEHVGTLWAADMDPLSMLSEKAACIINIFSEHVAQLIHSLHSGIFVSADQGVHGEHICLIVV